MEVYLDTFNDQRRAYCLSTNAMGIQWDSRYTETTGGGGADGGGHQPSFDALWYSDGRVTDEGYIVSMAVPFKSIRFPSTDVSTWRILFGRSIPRTSEYVAWPHVSRSIQGYLTQTALLTGMQNISPGKNLQFIPYTTYRSFRLLQQDADPPRFVSDSTDAAVGLDTKFVLKDSVVFDLALNPDFSQVESDEPQVTVNQRFEVFFREKRPFFLENAQFFETPLNLVFTRRIADPQLGGRVTGKQGAYTFGVLYASDEAPGKLVPEDSPFAGSDAQFGIVRLSRDILSQSAIGLLFTTRSFESLKNQLLGGDFRFRIGDHWQATGQAVKSWSDSEQVQENGAAYSARLKRTGLKFELDLAYEDVSPDFLTLTGFIPRLDYRKTTFSTSYHFRPEGNVLIAWGPELEMFEAWDYEGLRLDAYAAPAFFIGLQRQTEVRLKYFDFHQRLRPVDFPVLLDNVDFNTPGWSVSFQTSYWKWGKIEVNYEGARDINFAPPEGQSPSVADRKSAAILATVRPLRQMQLGASYFFTSLRSDQGAIFDNHILSLRANYQFTRPLSLRLILQYETTAPDILLTSLEDRRNLNADLLLTYQLNPWTALYVGYNSNRQNLSLVDENGRPRVVRTDGPSSMTPTSSSSNSHTCSACSIIRNLSRCSIRKSKAKRRKVICGFMQCREAMSVLCLIIKRVSDYTGQGQTAPAGLVQIT